MYSTSRPGNASRAAAGGSAGPRLPQAIHIVNEEHDSPRPPVSESFADLLRPYGTTALLLINITLYVLMGFRGGPTLENLIDFGARYSPLIWEGQHWRFLTAIFLHADPLHLFFNCACLLSIGRSMEVGLQTRNFLIIYFFSGLAGGLLSDAFGPDTSVGASGAIYGLLGSALILNIVAAGGLWRSLSLGSTQLLLFFIALGLLMGAAVEHVDSEAHVGGFLGGIFITLYLSRRAFRHPGRRRMAMAAGLAGIALLAAAVAAALPEKNNPDRLARIALANYSIARAYAIEVDTVRPYAERALALDATNDLALHTLILDAARTGRTLQLPRTVAGEIRGASAFRALREASQEFSRARYREAARAFERYLALRPDSNLGKACRAVALVYTNEDPAAIQALIDSIKGPNAYESWTDYARVTVLLRQDRVEEAWRHATNARNRDSRHIAMMTDFHNDMAARGRVAEASAAFEFLFNEYVRRGESRFGGFRPDRANTKAYLYAVCNVRLHEALAAASEAVNAVAGVSEAERAMYLDTLGWVYHQLGDYDAAFRYLNEAAAGSQDGVIHFHLAETRRRMPGGDYRQAMESYKRALASGDLGFDEYRRAIQGLIDVQSAEGAL